jgi:putative sterol carrier protein
VAKHQFLSPTWIEETRKLREEYKDKVNPPATPPLRMNLVVEEVPFETDELEAHVDTSSGEPEIEVGHLESADALVVVDYKTAKTVFVDGNMSAAMEGLQLGRIRVQGDMMKLMALAGLNADPGSIELARRIRDITE